MLDSTSPTPELSIRSPLGLLASALFVLVSAFGCARSSTADSSETHFLSRCSQDSDCPEALACVCGACTRSCETASNCSELDAKCLPPVGECSAELSCVVECESDDECGGGKCTSGRCRHDSSSGIGRVQAGGGDVAQETDDGEGGTISEADAALASNPPIASEYTACESDTDCELRVGTQCCPGCGYQTTRADGDEYYAGGIVALSDPDAFWADVCGDVPISCDPCGPRPIANEVGAACVAGHCSVQYDGSPLTFPADEGDPNPPN